MNAEGKVAQQLTKTIQPSHGWVPLRLGALWARRELLYFLVWRDIKVRYKQTVFGVLWAVLQPLMLTVVFSIFLGHLARSEEHTSELQSLAYLVCRLLLEKKKKYI